MMRNMAGMMKKVQEMQSRMEELQAEMARTEFTAAVGGDSVTVTVTGKGEMRAVRINPLRLMPRILACWKIWSFWLRTMHAPRLTGRWQLA